MQNIIKNFSLEYQDCFIKNISEPRLKQYLIYTDNDIEKAIMLYHENIKVSSELWNLVSLCEIVFRNSLDRVLFDFFQDDAWLINKMFRNHLPKELADGIELKISLSPFLVQKNFNKKELNNKIVAKLSLGTWLKFFDKGSEDLFRKVLYKAFPYFHTTRKRLAKELNFLQKIRNKIAHHGSLLILKRYEYELFFGFIDTNKHLIILTQEDIKKIEDRIFLLLCSLDADFKKLNISEIKNINLI